MSKRKLVISLSGGRTSAVMTKEIIKRLSDQFEITIIFANTGCEDEYTLEFIERLSNNFGWEIIWVEAVVNPIKGKGITHKIVDFHSASRKGEPFKEVIKKYGIFNMANPACTNRLKVEPINDYLKTNGFKKGNKLDHLTAIGFRADEADRKSERADDFGFIYPLIRWGYTKRDVAKEIKTWDFDLEIKGDHHGNCKWCWKKSDRKLYTLALEDPEAFIFPYQMEAEFSSARKEMKNKSPDGKAYFFRKDRSTRDIIEEAKKGDFIPYTDDPYSHAYDFDPNLDVGVSCGESCEISPDHMIEQEFPFMADYRCHDLSLDY